MLHAEQSPSVQILFLKTEGWGAPYSLHFQSNLINLWTRLQVDFVVVSTKIHIVSFSPLTLALNHQCVGSLARLSGWRSDRILWIISSGNLVNPKGLQTFFSCTCVLGEFLPLFIFYINKTYFSYPVSEHILICIILKTN